MEFLLLEYAWGDQKIEKLSNVACLEIQKCWKFIMDDSSSGNNLWKIHFIAERISVVTQTEIKFVSCSSQQTVQTKGK